MRVKKGDRVRPDSGSDGWDRRVTPPDCTCTSPYTRAGSTHPAVQPDGRPAAGLAAEQGLVEAEEPPLTPPAISVTFTNAPVSVMEAGAFRRLQAASSPRSPPARPDISHQVPDDAKIRPAVGPLGLDHRQQPGSGHRSLMTPPAALRPGPRGTRSRGRQRGRPERRT